MPAYIEVLEKTDKEKWTKLRDGVVILEAGLRGLMITCRAVLMILNSIVGPSAVNQQVIEETDLAFATQQLAGAPPPPSPEELVASFDMETAVRAKLGTWECGTLRCATCTLDQNLFCLGAYDILAPPNAVGQTDRVIQLRLHKSLRDAQPKSNVTARTRPRGPAPPPSNNPRATIGDALLAKGIKVELPTKPYDPKKCFEVNDNISHPKFGIGRVSGADTPEHPVSRTGNARIHVEFPEPYGRKTLAQGRS